MKTDTENRGCDPRGDNSTKHGLTARADRAIAGEDPEALAAFFKSIHDALQPVGAAEAAEVSEVAKGYWRLRRVDRFEKAVLDLSFALYEQDCANPPDPLPDIWPTEEDMQTRSALPRDIYAEKLHRHELHAVKMLGAAINRLTQLRALRSGNPAPVYIVQSPIPRRQRRPKVQSKSGKNRITALTN